MRSSVEAEAAAPSAAGEGEEDRRRRDHVRGERRAEIAAAAGFTHPVWPTKIVTAKVIVLGLDGSPTGR